MLDSGGPFELEPFQLEVMDDYFAGVRELVVMLPTGNGKTTLLGALGLYHLRFVSDASVPVAAASREQATVLFNQAWGFARRTPGLRDRFKVQAGYKRILSLDPSGGELRVFAADADTGDGVIPTLALVDELHRHRSGELYGVWRDKLTKRGGQIITISTAGDDDESPLGALRARALRMPGVRRDGMHTVARSPDFVMHEWSLSLEDDPDDLEVVKAANPSPIVTLEELRKRHDSPTMMRSHWLRFTCNVWSTGEDAAISPLDWSRCAVPGLEIPDGASVWLGVDLGWKWDTTAIVPLSAREDGEWWVGRPEIIVPPRNGTATRENRILEPIRAMRDRWDIAGVVLDPNAGGEQLAEHLEAMGLTVVSHSQDPAPMCLASQRLSDVIREGRLRHPDDGGLNAHVLTAEAKMVGEKWRLVAPTSRGPTTRRRVVDAAIALAMVLSVASTDEPAYTGPLFEVIA